MVVGFHGRKGPKADPTVMGTAVQYLSVHSVAPVIIIKEPLSRKERPEGFSFASCCDGSWSSTKSLELLCNMRGPADKIHIIICEQHNIDTSKIRQNVSDHLEERDCLEFAEINVIKSVYGKATKDLIREYILDRPSKFCDFIIVGNKGADFSGSKDKYLGSVANEILIHTKLNTVFVSK